MDPTTTAIPPVDGAAAVAQPVEGASTAVQPTEPQSHGQPAQVDETAAWLESKGLTREDPEYLDKITKMAFNSEKLMTKATTEASEIKKSLTPQGQPTVPTGQPGDPAVQEFIQDYRRDKQISSFKSANKDWEQHEPAMVDLLEEVVATPYGNYKRSQLVNEGLLSLNDVYAMAKGSVPANTEQIKTQAQQEVLHTLANTQRAGGGTAQASNSNPQASSVDPINEAIRKARG